MHAFRVGGAARWEFLLAGDVCRQVAEAEVHAAKVETVVSPEAWRCAPGISTYLPTSPAISLYLPRRGGALHCLTLTPVPPTPLPRLVSAHYPPTLCPGRCACPTPLPPAWWPRTTPPPLPRLVSAHYHPPPTHAGVRALPPTLPRLVAAHYEGEPRGEWTGGAGPMLLRRLAAGVQDPGARGVGAALREHLVCDELLQLQRKQQSQLLLNAAFHEAPSP